MKATIDEKTILNLLMTQLRKTEIQLHSFQFLSTIRTILDEISRAVFTTNAILIGPIPANNVFHASTAVNLLVGDSLKLTAESQYAKNLLLVLRCFIKAGDLTPLMTGIINESDTENFRKMWKTNLLKPFTFHFIQKRNNEAHYIRALLGKI
jgi:hypothetical protein